MGTSSMTILMTVIAGIIVLIVTTRAMNRMKAMNRMNILWPRSNNR